MRSHRADVLAFTGFPKEIWRQTWPGQSAGAPTWPGSSPGRDSLIRLVGAVLAEQHNEWTEGRRYLGLDVLACSRITLATGSTDPPGG